MIQSKLFKLVFTNCVPSLFAETVYKDGQKALRAAMREDFLKQKELTFINPNNGETYVRHYGCMPQGDVTIIDVGNFVDGDFMYATIGINNSKLRYDPYIAIVNFKPAFKNADVVAKMVESAINYALKPRGLEVKLEPWDIKKEKEKIMWMRDFAEAYFAGKHRRDFNPMVEFGFEMLQERLMALGKKASRPRNSDDILDYLYEGTEGYILPWLHKMVDKYDQPQDMMRAVRALYELELILKISYEAFIKEFGKEGLIARNTYNGYMSLVKTPYLNDEKYDPVKKAAMKKFNVSGAV